MVVGSVKAYQSVAVFLSPICVGARAAPKRKLPFPEACVSDPIFANAMAFGGGAGLSVFEVEHAPIERAIVAPAVAKEVKRKRMSPSNMLPLGRRGYSHTRQRPRLDRRELERHASIARRPSDAMPPAPSGATPMEHREQPGDTVGGGSDGDEVSAGAAVLGTASV